jgi:hypothetical protein
MTIQSVATASLRPTQMAVGMRLMKWKAKSLRKLDRKPQELVNFILENPIRVVLGPKQQAFVTDHHHLGLALLDEGFKTSPVVVMADLSSLSANAFWLDMEKRQWLRAVDNKGRAKTIEDIPDELEDLKDDPYRSLAGFVRYQGGFTKTETPYMEFQWADYFRPLIKPEQLKKNFDKAVRAALKLVHLPEAQKLPGYVATRQNKSGKDTETRDDS